MRREYSENNKDGNIYQEVARLAGLSNWQTFTTFASLVNPTLIEAVNTHPEASALLATFPKNSGGASSSNTEVLRNNFRVDDGIYLISQYVAWFWNSPYWDTTLHISLIGAYEDSIPIHIVNGSPMRVYPNVWATNFKFYADSMPEKNPSSAQLGVYFDKINDF